MSEVNQVERLDVLVTREAARIQSYKPINLNFPPDKDFNTALSVDYEPGAYFNATIPERVLIWRGLAKVYEGAVKTRYFLRHKSHRTDDFFVLLDDRIKLTSFGVKMFEQITGDTTPIVRAPEAVS